MTAYETIMVVIGILGLLISFGGFIVALWHASQPTLVRQEYIGKEVMQMTAYETIMVVIGILGLLISFGGFIVAFIAFLDKRNKDKKMPTLSANGMDGAP